MQRERSGTVAVLAVVVAVCTCLGGGECTPYSRFQYVPRSSYAAPVVQISRPQRSIYGPAGWNGVDGGGGIAFGPVGLGHITKDELITLLEAWKEIESDAEEKIEPEPAPPAQTKAAEPEAKAPPPGVPLTVSLPAFVPIQLSAMYTAPAPGGGGGAERSEGGRGGGDVEAPEPVPEPEPAEPEEPPPPPPPPARPAPPAAPPSLQSVQHAILKIWTTQPQQLAPAMAAMALVPKKAVPRGKGAGPKSVKQRNFASTYFVAPAPRNFGPPPLHGGSGPRIYTAPPPFLPHAPGPLKLVPSSHLLSNWR